MIPEETTTIIELAEVVNDWNQLVAEYNENYVAEVVSEESSTGEE